MDLADYSGETGVVNVPTLRSAMQRRIRRMLMALGGAEGGG